MLKKYFYLFPLCYLLSLSIVAPSFLKLYGNNSLVITLLISVIIYTVFLLNNTAKPSYVYPLALFVISLSVLYCFMLRSDHLFGCDIHLEYYEFALVAENGRWIPYNLYSSCLSITIFPMIFSSITALNGEFVFRFLYPFLLSFVPVILFRVYRRWVGDDFGFVCALFFIASSIYLEHIPSLGRQVVALVFLALIVLITAESFDSLIKRGAFAVLSWGLIVSHYSTGWIYLFVLFSLMFFPYLKSRLRNKIVTSDERAITFRLFILVFCFALIWYTIVSGTAFSVSVGYLYNVYKNLAYFFFLESRSPVAMELVGIYPRQGLPNIFGYWLGNVIRGIILVGIMAFYLKKNKTRSFKIKGHYAFVGLTSVVVLVLFTIMPYTTMVYNLDRLYLTLLVFLLPFLPFGLQSVIDLFPKLREKRKLVGIFLSALLVLQMAYAFGLVHQISGYHSFVVINKFDDATVHNDLSPDSRYYIFDQEVVAAQWLAQYVPNTRLRHIVSDPIGKLIMTSHVLVYYDYETVLRSNSSDYLNFVGSYFFLRYENAKYHKIYVGKYIGITNLISELSKQNRIHDNGISQTYQITRTEQSE